VDSLIIIESQLMGDSARCMCATVVDRGVLASTMHVIALFAKCG